MGRRVRGTAEKLKQRVAAANDVLRRQYYTAVSTVSTDKAQVQGACRVALTTRTASTGA